MNSHATLRWGVLFCVLLSFLAFGIAEESPFALLLLLVTGTAGWWFTERRPMRPAASETGDAEPWHGLPRWVTNIALAFVILMAVLRGSRGDSVISAFAAFLAAICVLKLWEKREPTDYGQLLTMSVFLVIGATLNSNSFGIGIVILLKVPVLVVTAFHYQIFLAKVDGGIHPAMHGNPTVGMIAKRAKRALRGWSVVVVILGFVLATFVFVVTPRGLGNGELGTLGALSPLRRTGFASQVDLNTGGLISQSQAIILSAGFTDGKNRPVGSAEEPQYLRGVVLDVYANGKWTSGERSVSSFPAEQVTSGYALKVGEEPNAALYNVTINPRTMPYKGEPIFHPLRAVKVSLGGDGRVRLDPLTGAMSRELGRGDWMYTLHWTMMPDESEETRRGMIGFPSRVVQDEAKRLLGNSGIPVTPEERNREMDSVAARVFETYLRSRFQYSLNVPTPPNGVDPIEWFLQNKPAAHCEFFASALAAMCRSVGIDARVVAGYMTTEYDTQQQAYVVRASNAHAWTEVNTSPGVWRVYDGTPVASPVFRAQRRVTILGTLGAMMAGLDSLWNSKVVAYDDRSQRRVLGMDSGNAQVPWIIDALQGLQGRPSFDMPRRSRNIGKLIAVGFGVVLVVGGLGAIVWSMLPKRMKRGGSGWALRGEFSQAHVRLLRAMEAIGAPKPDHVPMMQHLRSVAERHEDGATRAAAAGLMPACEALYVERFGGGESGGDVRRRVERLVAGAMAAWRRSSQS